MCRAWAGFERAISPHVGGPFLVGGVLSPCPTASLARSTTAFGAAACTVEIRVHDRHGADPVAPSSWRVRQRDAAGRSGRAQREHPSGSWATTGGGEALLAAVESASSHSTASGLIGEPVAISARRGDAMNSTSNRPSSRQAAPRAERSRLSIK